MSGIFVSYRRDDSAHATGPIYAALCQRFRWVDIFRDVDTIPAGRDFSRVIANAVRHSNVLLAVIGRSWVESRDAAGHRRLDNPADFVRLELEAALTRGIPVLVVLIDSARAPTADVLPPSLAGLAECPCTSVRPGSAFPEDMEHLSRLVIATRRMLVAWRPSHGRIVAVEAMVLAYTALCIYVALHPSLLSDGPKLLLVLGIGTVGVALYALNAFAMVQALASSSQAWFAVLILGFIIGPTFLVPSNIAFGLFGPRRRQGPAVWRRFEK